MTVIGIIIIVLLALILGCLCGMKENQILIMQKLLNLRVDISMVCDELEKLRRAKQFTVRGKL